ncbi:unnamed protein product [Prorocentrum cordatum]|uniref:EF-hand domain-containing protein n=1 Tax=Prorocentrum cordatum TaxID=2364126 RepID=A0ABN9S051_9DINO|nr:unnamed protein product [Polarella glacialis]
MPERCLEGAVAEKARIERMLAQLGVAAQLQDLEVLRKALEECAAAGLPERDLEGATLTKLYIERMLAKLKAAIDLQDMHGVKAAIQDCGVDMVKMAIEQARSAGVAQKVLEEAMLARERDAASLPDEDPHPAATAGEMAGPAGWGTRTSSGAILDSERSDMAASSAGEHGSPLSSADALCRELIGLAEVMRQDFHSEVDHLVQEHTRRLKRVAEGAVSIASASPASAQEHPPPAWRPSPVRSSWAGPSDVPGRAALERPSPLEEQAQLPRGPHGAPPHLAPKGPVAGEAGRDRPRASNQTADGLSAEMHARARELREAGHAREGHEVAERAAETSFEDPHAPGGVQQSGLLQAWEHDEPGPAPVLQLAKQASVNFDVGEGPNEKGKLARVRTTSLFGSSSGPGETARQTITKSRTALFEQKLERMQRNAQASRGAKTILKRESTNESIQKWIRNQQGFRRVHERCFFEPCRRLVHSDFFDQTMGMVLLINALTIGLQVDWLARNKASHTPLVFLIFDWLFCIVFVAELSVRVLSGPRSFTHGPEWRWNFFDTTVVVIQVTVALLDGQEGAIEALDKLHFVRILRLCRLARFLRMVRLFPGLRSMVFLLVDCIGSFFWACIMLIGLMFCMAIYFTELYTSLCVKHPDEDHTSLEEFWGSVPRSFLALYMAIFGGVDWKDLLDVYKAFDPDTYIINTVIMLAYVAFTTLVMLNLVTGVFVDGAQRIVQEDRDKGLLRLAARIFEAADQDGSKDISGQEFEDILSSELMMDFCEINNISVNEVDTLYKLLAEGDDEGNVTITDFVRGCKMLQGEARAADVQTVKLMCKQHFEQTEHILLRLHQSRTQSRTDLASGPLGGFSPGGNPFRIPSTDDGRANMLPMPQVDVDDHLPGGILELDDSKA